MKLYYDNDWVDMFLYYLNPATNNLDWATGGLS